MNTRGFSCRRIVAAIFSAILFPSTPAFSANNDYLFQFNVPLQLKNLPSELSKVYLICIVRGGTSTATVIEANPSPPSPQRQTAKMAYGAGKVTLSLNKGEYKGPSPRTVLITEMNAGNPGDVDHWVCLISSSSNTAFPLDEATVFTWVTGQFKSVVLNPNMKLPIQ